MLNKKYMDTPKNFDELEYKHMVDLVQSNLVTFTCYYNNHMVAFCNLFKKYYSIFSKINDFYFVLEFQNRGSEHDRGLSWIKDSMIYGVNNYETIEQFITFFTFTRFTNA